MTTQAEASGARRRGRRGGRTKGSWSLVHPDELLAFRQEHRISRNVLATALGVSGTSIQNWETGQHVAEPDLQATLAKLMAAGPNAIRAAAAGAKTEGPTSALARVMTDQLSATGAIVAGYLSSRGEGMTQEELVELVRQVRAALSGEA